jgi:hypothetical protein
MIGVEFRAEPTRQNGFDFEVQVRQKGRRLLKILLGQAEPDGLLKNRKKVADRLGDIEPKKHLIPYWQGDCLDRLYDAYDGMCAYLSILIDRSTADPTVDHFIPQTAGGWGRVLAYEWSNYRLSALPPNRKKGVKIDLLDPFDVVQGDYQLEFFGFNVRPGDELPPDRCARVERTIHALGLNDKRHRDTRERLVGWWEMDALPLESLALMAPFIHVELVRQGGSKRRRVNAPPPRTESAKE